MDFLSGEQGSCLFEELSHKSVRIYFHRLKKVINLPEKKKRRLIAIDETKVVVDRGFLVPLGSEQAWFEL